MHDRCGWQCIAKLQNFRHTYVFITLLYIYVKTPYLNQQTNLTVQSSKVWHMFKATVKIPERFHWERLLRKFWLLTLNYFTPVTSFPIVDIKQVNVCWENYLTFYSLDICFNVSTKRRHDLTRSNVGNSVIVLVSQT